MPATLQNSKYKCNNLVHFDKYLLSHYKRIKHFSMFKYAVRLEHRRMQYKYTVFHF